MRRVSFLPILLALLFSCGTSNKEVGFVPPPSNYQSPLERKISGGISQEMPMTPPVNPNKLDECTRRLLFTDQYITASDYGSAREEIKEAEKYCPPNDPRFLYMKAIVDEAFENEKEAYKLFYRAAKIYLKRGDLDGAFKCYSGMVTIDPNGKEVKELKKYFVDEDY